MANPFIGVLVNGQYYNYVPGSYSRDRIFANAAIPSANSLSLTVMGIKMMAHTVTLHLDNTFTPYDPVGGGKLGPTTYTGTSRLAELMRTLGGVGASMPIPFVAPDGVTHLVVPTGRSTEKVFNENSPNPNGVEWRVNLTLQNTQIV